MRHNKTFMGTNTLCLHRKTIHLHFLWIKVLLSSTQCKLIILSSDQQFKYFQFEQILQSKPVTGGFWVWYPSYFRAEMSGCVVQVLTEEEKMCVNRHNWCFTHNECSLPPEMNPVAFSTSSRTQVLTMQDWNANVLGGRICIRHLC